MIVFHGHNKDEFVIQKHINSRYGFPCLFFSSNINLALNYGKNVIKLDISPIKTIDFKGKISHSLEFRNLIYSLRNENSKSVLIKNVYDRPNDTASLEFGDILVVFDLITIQNFENAHH